MPLVPDTLAAAEDLNTVLQDIAAAITGSMAVDGSTAFTGSVNFNNQAIGGIGNLSATGTITGAVLNASSSINAPTITGTNVNVSGFVQSGGGRLISTHAGGNPSIVVWDTSQNLALGIMLGSGGSLYFAGFDGSGNYSGLNLGHFDTGGNFTAQGSIAAAGNMTANSNIYVGGSVNSQTVSTNYLGMNGDIQMNGHTLANPGAITGYGGNTNFYGVLTLMNAYINANAQSILNLYEITGLSGTVIMNATLNMAGNSIINANIAYSAPVSEPIAAVRAMARQRTGSLDVVETLSALIAAVAELSHAPA